MLSAIGADCGRVYFATGRWSCIKNTIRFWGRDGLADTRFLYYATSGAGVWPRRGSAQPFISQGDARAMRIVLPADVDEQRHIASILGALDDKIDSNRRLAALLKDTAAAIFKARFVDFVGAEEFEKSEIGRVPKGWRVGALSDLGRFINGRAFTKDANGRGRAIIRIRELNSGIDDGTPRSDIATSRDHIASADDILFAWSGSLGLYRWPGPESLINQHIFKVIPDNWPAWFVYCWIQEHMSQFRAIAQDKATTMGHIQRRHLAEATVVMPDSETMAAADGVVRWLDEHRQGLVNETSTVRELRDALLPKLISGEIRVPDTRDSEEVIGPVVEELAEAAQ